MSSENLALTSDDIAISVRNLTKTYRLFSHPGDRVKQFLSLGFKHYHRKFTALQNISFDIRKGETIGIIGRNGSGKSTLLQLISGILKPTSGSVYINGRVSALLELGAGFNPEFTGRENVYFQGATQGLSKAEMDIRIDAITRFADIGDFIDQPVRTYSSGMFIRLAFAVAVSVDPDILLVDEALAVGDIGFQRKCIEHMEMLREHGTTIVLVSHNSRQVERFCSQVILLEQGNQIFHGPSEAGCNLYLQTIETTRQADAAEDGNLPIPETRDSRITVKSVSVGEVGSIGMHEPLAISICLELHEDMKGLEFITGMHTKDLVYVALSSSNRQISPQPMPRGTYHIQSQLTDSLLRPGQYWIGLGIYDLLGRTLWRGDRVRSFFVSAKDSDITALPTSGLLDLPFRWSITKSAETLN